ncbi:unnamed protein product, partial [Laminaria digitata]
GRHRKPDGIQKAHPVAGSDDGRNVHIRRRCRTGKIRRLSAAARRETFPRHATGTGFGPRRRVRQEPGDGSDHFSRRRAGGTAETMPGAEKLVAFTAQADLRAALEDWRRWLITERRTSAHTVDGYCRDIAAFLSFLGDYRGEIPDIATLADMKPADFRAWLAARLQDGLSRTSIARAMSALRNLFRFLDRTGRVHNQALAAVKVPKPPKSVPKPLNA